MQLRAPPVILGVLVQTKSHMILVMKMSPVPNMLVILVLFPFAVTHQQEILL
jgi:hypothetical protein